MFKDNKYDHDYIFDWAGTKSENETPHNHLRDIDEVRKRNQDSLKVNYSLNEQEDTTKKAKENSPNELYLLSYGVGKASHGQRV